MEAVATKASLRQSPDTTAGMSEAWRGFWSLGTNCRAYTSVALQGCWQAGNKSCYTMFYREHWSGRLTTEPDNYQDTRNGFQKP